MKALLFAGATIVLGLGSARADVVTYTYTGGGGQFQSTIKDTSTPGMVEIDLDAISLPSGQHINEWVFRLPQVFNWANQTLTLVSDIGGTAGTPNQLAGFNNGGTSNLVIQWPSNRQVAGETEVIDLSGVPGITADAFYQPFFQQVFFGVTSSTASPFDTTATLTVPAPEPSSIALLGVGFFGIGFTMLRRRLMP